MKKFIDLLEKELGYSEKADAYTKFGDWYGKNIEFDADYSSAPWCDMYLSWAAAKLGYEDWVGQFAWTVAHAEWFQEQDAWGKTPKPGAFVFYDWRGGNDVDGIDHVGIVTRVEGNTIHTIEGNIDGGVAKRKERDTSKVVGYGYPEKIKARLDKEAARKRDEQEVKASTGHPSDGDGLPDQGLTALIPQTAPEQAHAPLSAPSPQKTAESPAAPKSGANRPTEERPEAARPGVARPGVASTAPEAGKAVKKGKHAKPATADTNAATTAPLPVIVDTKPADTTTALGTPAFIGSALIAALAVLAVAKTRQLRVRPAAATPAKPAPKRGRRRRPRRGQIALRTTSEVTLTTEETTPAERPLDLTFAGLESAPAKPGTELPLRTGAVLDRPIDTISAQMEATANALDTRQPALETRQPALDTTPAVDTRQPAVDTSHYVFSEDTGALPRIFDEPGLDLDRLTAKALENLDAATARAVEPFDPFTPRMSAPKKTDSYHGRRRRPERPTELDTAFAQNAQYAPARGRRHRASAHATFVGDILDTPEAFTQEAPLRGRRHRRTEASRRVNA
ncbi:CHAP domain-containing protein [Nonomuraea sp. NPDC050394]|uniref:CHAP domain-containing protein n=1 Tax=Nonomuraea sp. NPDC050394 TaxID=3364363 RepID=UPI00379CC0B4